MSLKTRLRIAATNLLAASAGRLTGIPNQLRVFTFHDIRDDSDDLYAIGKDLLADFLMVAKDEGYTCIRTSDVLKHWPSVVQERTIVLTFDDGYSSNSDVVAELLGKCGMVATFFVISSLVKPARQKARFAGTEREFLCARDLRDLEGAGFEIGSHSHNHVLCGRVPKDQLSLEFNASKQSLQEMLGKEVTSFAYPFGRRGAYSAETRAVLAASGFTAGFIQEGTGITLQTDPLEIPRVSIDRFDTPRTFRRKLNGWYEMGERLRNRATKCLRLA